VTISSGSSARRRSTSVTSARSEGSSGAVSVTLGSDRRSLLASRTNDPDSSGIVIPPLRQVAREARLPPSGEFFIAGRCATARSERIIF
jgi:hypothetical protein